MKKWDFLAAAAIHQRERPANFPQYTSLAWIDGLDPPRHPEYLSGP